MRTPRPLIPVVVLLLVGASCHKSSSSPPPNNLTATAVVVATPQPRVGYPFEVVTTIEALEDAADVSVSYYALNGDDVASELEEVRQFYIGTVTFPEVRVGTPDYRAELTIPASLTPPGDYLLLCTIDPSDLIRENDEDDNEAEVATTFAPIADPNIYLQEFVLDRQSILLDPDIVDVPGSLAEDVQNTDAGGTLTVGVQGSLDPVEMEAFVRLRVTRTDLPAGQNAIEVPLYLWDSAGERYVDVFGPGLVGNPEWLSLGAIAPGSVVEGGTQVTVDAKGLTSVHLDLYVPGELTNIVVNYLENGQQPVGGPLPVTVPWSVQQELWTYLLSGPQPVQFSSLEFEVLADVRAKDAQFVDSNPLDNSRTKPIYAVLPGEESSAPGLPLEYESGLDSFWENDRFGVGFDFDSFATVDGRGAIAEVVGSVPAEVFGNRFDFMRFDARAQVVPAIEPSELPPGENSGFSLDLEFASLTLYSYEEPLGYVFTGGPEPFVKEKSFNKTFFIGPVPVTATGGVMGEIGYELAVNLQPTSLACSVTPYATLSATLTGAVGVAGLSGGAGAELTLLDERFIVSVNTGISLDSANTNAFEGEVQMQVRNVLSGPSGRVYLFAEYPGVRWCRRRVLGKRISYPCGTRTIRKERNLVTWETFQKEDVLFDETLCKRVERNNGVATFNLCTLP